MALGGYVFFCIFFPFMYVISELLPGSETDQRLTYIFWGALAASIFAGRAMGNISGFTYKHKIERFVLLHIGILIVFKALVGSSDDLAAKFGMDSELSFYGSLAIVSLISFFLVLVTPYLGKFVSFIGNNSFKKSTSSSTNDNSNWFLDKVVAPTIVGFILGLISFWITGSFTSGATIALLSIPVSLFGP